MLELRTEIDELISRGAVETAYVRLAELWRTQGGFSSAAFVLSRAPRLIDKLAVTSYRLAILRSFTVEPAVPLLRAAAFLSGINLKIHVGAFNDYANEILDPESSLYRFAPDATILAVQTSDVAPELWQQYVEPPAEDARAVIERVSYIFRKIVCSFRDRNQAALIVHSLEQPTRPTFGLLDTRLEVGQAFAIRQINHEIRKTATEQRGVYLLDYDNLVARHGRLRWRDEGKWLTARMPIAANYLIHLSNEWLRYLVPLSGKTSKVLVVDLDNVLWGGIIGEDGMSGIELGSEYPGAAYQAVQRFLLDLVRRGILLAICSKNNFEDAMAVLRDHPGMLLRPEHFAAVRINWNDKVQNLREIAAELGIGLDAFAFMDDNPAEREQIRTALPEVAVIDLPCDPLKYSSALWDFPAFERLTFSKEDGHRTTYYAAQAKTSEAELNFQCKEDFYRFLNQEAEIASVLPSTLARISQLTQKTNQFNLTTRRYTEQQIEEIAGRVGCQVLSIRLRDRFGDHGLVGVAITSDEKATCEIDTLLLSCRVIGRTVETAFLSYIARAALKRGCRCLSGSFFLTKKNAPAYEFYRQHGFQLEGTTGDSSFWTLDLHSGQPIACPEWIKLSVP